MKQFILYLLFFMSLCVTTNAQQISGSVFVDPIITERTGDLNIGAEVEAVNNNFYYKIHAQTYQDYQDFGVAAGITVEENFRVYAGGKTFMVFEEETSLGYGFELGFFDKVFGNSRILTGVRYVHDVRPKLDDTNVGSFYVRIGYIIKP